MATYAGEVKLNGQVYTQIAFGKVLGKTATVFIPVRNSTADTKPVAHKVRWGRTTATFSVSRDLTAKESDAWVKTMRDMTPDALAHFIRVTPFSWWGLV